MSSWERAYTGGRRWRTGAVHVGRLLSTFVEQNGVLRWERDELYLGGQLLGAVRAWQPDPGEDYDQDHRSDVVVYRPSTGTWFILSSASSYTTYTAYGFGGQAGDVPVPGDFDGDGTPDLGIYRPSTGTWYVLKSSTAFTTWDWFGWGGVGDLPAAGDFDQDGKTDAAVYRTATGEWFVKPSSGATPWSVTLGGASGDVPAVGDYDGDRRADVAVYRPSTATWLILTSSSGYVTVVTYQFGATNDVPVPADVDGDGTTDLAVYRSVSGTWFALTSSSGFTNWTSQGWGAPGDVPVPATDFDGDGRADYVVYRPTTGQWFVKPSGGGTPWSVQFGASGDVAVQPVVAPGVPAHPTVYVDYYHLDALGSVRAVTGELGTALARHDFLPFGEEWTGVPSRETRLFTGHERDAETGLDYFGARYYEASIGRFTTPDIPGVDQYLTDPQSWNRYAYVRSNPLGYIDPLGLQKDAPPPRGGGATPTFRVQVWGCDEACQERERLAQEQGVQLWLLSLSMLAGSRGAASSFGLKVRDLGRDVKNAACSAIPNGRTVGLNGTLGLLAGGTSSAEQVVNYDTGAISLFASGGLQGGWNGGAQGNLFVGMIYGNLGGLNQNYKGPFTTLSGSFELVGGYVQTGTGVKVIGGSVGANLLSGLVPFTYGVSGTVTSPPLQAGFVQSWGSSVDRLLFAARQLCR